MKQRMIFTRYHSISAITLLSLAVLLLLFIINPVMWVRKVNVLTLANTNKLKTDVSFLTSITPPRSYDNSESMNTAAAYIESQFSETGCNPLRQTFTANDTEYTNVICSFGTENKRVLVIGAHYDVAGSFPGADDNASGVAGLLELARLIHVQNPALEVRVDLVAYANEEPPYFRTEGMGSMIHAKSLKDAGEWVDLMISLEMIGYFTDEPNSQKYPTVLLRPFYPSTGNFIGVIGGLANWNSVRKVKTNLIKYSTLPVYSINAPSAIPGIDFSDHASYWKHGFDAVMISDTSFYRNPNYHKASDTANTLDYNRMGDVVNGVYGLIIAW